MKRLVALGKYIPTDEDCACRVCDGWIKVEKNDQKEWKTACPCVCHFCDTCIKYRGEMAPRHDPGKECEQPEKTAHCTCDWCF
jgi:hypothetical protein